MDLVVPQTLYGLVIAEVATLDRKYDGTIIFVGEMLKIYSLLAVTYLVQGFFLHGISGLLTFAEHDGWYATPCEDDHLTLKFVCVFVFEIAVFQDILACMNLFSVLWNVSTTGPDASFTLLQMEEDPIQTGGAVLAARVDEPEPVSKFSGMFFKVTPVPPVGMKQWDLSRVTRGFKVWAFLVVVIPKLTIVLVLGYYGGLFVAQQTHVEDLFMNTLAVTFVIDIDDFLYVAFTAEATKDNLMHMKPVTIDIDNRGRWSMWFWATVVHPLACIAVSALIINRALLAAGC